MNSLYIILFNKNIGIRMITGKLVASTTFCNTKLFTHNLKFTFNIQADCKN